MRGNHETVDPLSWAAKRPLFNFIASTSATLEALQENTRVQHHEIKESIIQPAVLNSCSSKNHTESGDGATLLSIQRSLDALIISAGFSFIGSRIVNLSGNPGHGYTYGAVIGESLIGIHTWPEIGTVDVNIHICGGEEKIEKFLKSLSDFYGSLSVNMEPRVRMSLT